MEIILEWGLLRRQCSRFRTIVRPPLRSRTIPPEHGLSPLQLQLEDERYFLKQRQQTSLPQLQYWEDFQLMAGLFNMIRMGLRRLTPCILGLLDLIRTREL